MVDRPDDREYARLQLNEAVRRLNFMRERISEVEEEEVIALYSEEKNEIVTGGDANNVANPEKWTTVLLPRQQKVTDIEGHIQNILIDCQMCVELSVKCMFKAIGCDFDYSHGINYESGKTQAFYHTIPSDYERRDDIVRAIFLTQLWSIFYEKAKYGAPELDTDPSIIFEIEDGERAINDASFCIHLAQDFLKYVEDNS